MVLVCKLVNGWPAMATHACGVRGRSGRRVGGREKRAGAHPGEHLGVWMCEACRPAGQSTTPLRAPEHQAVVEQTSRPLKPVRVTVKKGVKRRRRSAGDVVDRAGERGGRELRRW